MRLESLSEEEFGKIIEEYASEEEYDDYTSKKTVSDLLNTMENSSDRIKGSVNELREYMFCEKPNYCLIKKEIDKLNKNIRKMIKNVYEISLYSGAMDKSERLNMVEEQLLFSQDGEHLHITFSTLLPRRVTKDSPVKITDIKQMYEPAFRKQFSNGKHKIYSEKAVIIYTHYFSSKKEFVDHDNFETKVITDLITSWLLLDDSPRFCSIFMDYKIGEKSHTEVDVIPFARLKEFIN